MFFKGACAPVPSEMEPQWTDLFMHYSASKGQKCKQWQHTRIKFLCFSHQEVRKGKSGIYLGLSLLLSSF